MDSFTSIELIFELEDRLGIDIPEKETFKLITVGDIINYIVFRLSEKKK